MAEGRRSIGERLLAEYRLTRKAPSHMSDCAVYNEPAYPKGECNCYLNKYPKCPNCGAPLLASGFNGDLFCWGCYGYLGSANCPKKEKK